MKVPEGSGDTKVLILVWVWRMGLRTARLDDGKLVVFNCHPGRVLMRNCLEQVGLWICLWGVLF